MICWETITSEMTTALCVVQITLVRRKSHTCVCLLFSGASLVGRDEYMVEDSPSFLGSTGLFGRSGKPEGRKWAEFVFWMAEELLLCYWFSYCYWFQNIHIKNKTHKMYTCLCQRSALAAWFCVSCHRTLSQSHRGLRCTAPMQCQGAGPPAEDTASPNSPEGHKNRRSQAINKIIFHVYQSDSNKVRKQQALYN